MILIPALSAGLFHCVLYHIIMIDSYSELLYWFDDYFDGVSTDGTHVWGCRYEPDAERSYFVLHGPAPQTHGYPLDFLELNGFVPFHMDMCWPISIDSQTKALLDSRPIELKIA